MIQRIPYLIIALLSLVGVFVHAKKGILRTVQLFLFVNVLIGGYHTAAQMGLVGCSCFKSSWKVFGLPIALYSALLSLILLIGVEWMLRNVLRKKSNP